MQPTILPGVATWSRWQADRAMFFNAWFVAGEGGNFVVDPLEPDADDLAYVDERGLAAVVITNRDHERAAALFAQRYGVPVIASSPDADEMSVTVDRTVMDGDTLFGWRVVGLEGYKPPGEFALVHRATRSAITGDAFWGVPAGAVRLMPDEKLEDPARAALSIRALLALGVRHLLVGDGMPVFHHGWDALAEMLDARGGVLTRRVNLDELAFESDDAPAPYTGAAAEVGRLLGATRLGYALGVLEPGEVYCPNHWHTQEEEAFVVWSGTPTVRTPQGTFELRPGDVIAFPTGARGAHRHLERERGVVRHLDVRQHRRRRRLPLSGFAQADGRNHRCHRAQRTVRRLLRRRVVMVRIGAALAALLLALGTRAAAAPLARPAHVVVVIEENHTLAQVVESGNAPYLATVARSGALFTHASGVMHPSQPNYFALLSGRTNDNGDGCPARGVPVDAPNLASELLAAHLTFAAYSEALPADGFMGCSAGTYAQKHAPWTHFTNIPQNLHRPLSALTSFDALPTLAFVVPDVDDDMHDGTVKEGDDWAQAHLTPLLQWAATHDTLVVFTWDEGYDAQNSIPTMFVGPMIRPGKYAQRIDHYNVLRTLEELYGLPLTGKAATAAPITAIWK